MTKPNPDSAFAARGVADEMEKDRLFKKSLTPQPKPSHTPGPWVVIGKRNRSIVGAQNPKYPTYVAEFDYRHVTDENEGDAAFIVRAVNAHDELVEELKDAHDLIFEGTDIYHAPGDGDEDDDCSICEALDKAEPHP